MGIAKGVYVLTKRMPKSELFGLSSQMQRAAVSIPSNIAEGASRSKKEFLHFLHIAKGSAAELETQLLITNEVYKLDVKHLSENLKVVQKMLESLIKKI